MGKRTRGSSIAGAAGLAALIALATPAAAQLSRIGLVIGNGTYSAFPALPACLASSQNLANALRGLGYQVVERRDVTSGGLAAAVSEFARGMETTPDASIFVYVCGYAANMNDRPFPAARLGENSAAVRYHDHRHPRQALLDVLARGKPSRGLLALDLVPIPDAAAPVLDTLAQVPAPEGVGLIGVIGTPPTVGPTDLSAALTTGLAVPGIQSGTLLAGVEAELGRHPSSQISALRMPSVSRPFAGDEPPPPAALARPAEPEEAPATASESTPMPAQAAPPLPALPDEAAMTVSERRRVQEAFTRVGYYAGRIDGTFRARDPRGDPSLSARDRRRDDGSHLRLAGHTDPQLGIAWPARCPGPRVSPTIEHRG